MLKNVGEGDTTTCDLTDTLSTPTLPLELLFDSGPTCTGGTTCTYTPGTRQVNWSGNLAVGEAVTITYSTVVSMPLDYTDRVVIPATLGLHYTDADGSDVTSSSTSGIFINPYQIYLPVVLRM